MYKKKLVEISDELTKQTNKLYAYQYKEQKTIKYKLKKRLEKFLK